MAAAAAAVVVVAVVVVRMVVVVAVMVPRPRRREGVLPDPRARGRAAGAAAAGRARRRGCTRFFQLTHAWKAPGFKHLTYEVKTWFQSLLSNPPCTDTYRRGTRSTPWARSVGLHKLDPVDPPIA
jgi:hypothetical protein